MSTERYKDGIPLYFNSCFNPLDWIMEVPVQIRGVFYSLHHQGDGIFYSNNLIRFDNEKIPNLNLCREDTHYGKGSGDLTIRTNQEEVARV